MIIDFDRLFKLSAISIDFYQFLLNEYVHRSFSRPPAYTVDLRAAKLLKMSLKIVVIGVKITRQISTLAEVR